MMPFKSSNQLPKGFTLIEILLYTLLLAIGLAALTFIHLASLETHSLVSVEQELLETRRLTELAIQTRVAEATGVTTPASGSANQLMITSQIPSESPTTFSLLNQRLQMQLGVNPVVTITPSDVRVTNFTVTRLSGSPPSLAITITYEADAAKATVNTSSSFTITLRYE